MSTYYDYKRFVILPTDPTFISTEEQRLDTKMKDEYRNKDIYIVEKSFFEEFEDEFEAIEIDCLGNVMIWTKQKVWHLNRREKLEKLYYLPRHPKPRVPEFRHMVKK